MTLSGSRHGALQDEAAPRGRLRTGGAPHRIVVFAPHYAEYAARLAHGLAEQAHVLLVLDRLNRRNECGTRLPIEGERLRLVEFGSVGRAARLAALARILFHAALFRPTAINIQEEEGRFAAMAARMLRRLAPILLTVHDPGAHSGADADYLAANLHNRAATRAAATAFHVHGRSCRDALVAETGTARPILETPHGVLLVPSAAEKREPEPGRLLMFGRMEAYKGLDTLLDATDRLHARGLPFRLVLAGRGPEIGRLSQRIAASPFIDLVDRFLTVDEAIAQFQRAQCVVVPYRDATQSGVVSAAFGNGRPVVASRVGGLVDAVADGENGLLVPACDPDGLADALRRLLSGEARPDRLRGGAEQSAATDFAWPVIASAMVDFIERNVAARRPRA